jgi:hypothetical protein
MLEIIKFKEDTFAAKNFMTQEECEKVIKYFEFLVETGKLDWNQISFYESYAMGFWEADPDLIRFGLPSDYFNKLKQRIKSLSEELIGTELKEVSFHAQKWIDGAFAGFHSDNTDEHGNPTAFIRSKFASFIYLNEDFKGGRLNWKNYDISIKPEVGMIAIFDGGFGNEHEVATIKGGTRYTIGSFWDRADCVYTKEQEKAWEEELAVVRADQKVTLAEWKADRERGITMTYQGKVDE